MWGIWRPGESFQQVFTAQLTTFLNRCCSLEINSHVGGFYGSDKTHKGFLQPPVVKVSSTGMLVMLSSNRSRMVTFRNDNTRGWALPFEGYLNTVTESETLLTLLLPATIFNGIMGHLFRNKSLFGTWTIAQEHSWLSATLSEDGNLSNSDIKYWALKAETLVF